MINYRILLDTAIVEINGVPQSFQIVANQFGSLQFLEAPCAIVQTSPGTKPVMGRLQFCQNYREPPTIGAIVNHELHRDVIGVRWPNRSDWLDRHTRVFVQGTFPQVFADSADQAWWVSGNLKISIGTTPEGDRYWLSMTEKRGKPLASDMGKDSAATDQREEAITPVAGL